MSRSTLLAKNTLLLGIGQFIPKLLAILVLPILTKFLSQEEYGIYDLILSFASLSIPLMSLLIQQAAFRYLIAFETKKYQIISCTFFVLFLLAIFWAIVLLICCFFKLYENKVLVLIYILYLSETFYDTIGQIIRGIGKNLIYSLAIVLYSVINLIMLISLLKLNIINVNTVILISIIAYLSACLYLCYIGKIYLFFSIKKINLHLIKEMLKYSIPIIPSSLSLWVVNLSDRVIILTVLGASANGIYAASNKIPSLCGTAYAVFNLAWTEIAARTIDDNDRDIYYSNLYNSLFSFLIGVILVIIVLSPFIFSLLINENFYDGLKYSPILFIGVLFNCFVSFYGGVYVALSKTKQVGFSSIIGAFLNITINLLLINHIGLYAACISTVFSYIVIYFYRKKDINLYVKIRYNKKLQCYGYISLILEIILFYIDIKVLFILGGLIAFLFNIKFNLPIFKSILKRYVRK